MSLCQPESVSYAMHRSPMPNLFIRCVALLLVPCLAESAVFPTLAVLEHSQPGASLSTYSGLFSQQALVAEALAAVLHPITPPARAAFIRGVPYQSVPDPETMELAIRHTVRAALSSLLPLSGNDSVRFRDRHLEEPPAWITFVSARDPLIRFVYVASPLVSTQAALNHVADALKKAEHPAMGSYIHQLETFVAKFEDIPSRDTELSRNGWASARGVVTVGVFDLLFLGVIGVFGPLLGMLLQRPTAAHLMKEARQTAEQLSPKLRTEAYNVIGDHFLQMRRYRAAVDVYFQALTFVEVSSSRDASRSIAQLGKVHVLSGHRSEGKLFFEQAIDRARNQPEEGAPRLKEERLAFIAVRMIESGFYRWAMQIAEDVKLANEPATRIAQAFIRAERSDLAVKVIQLIDDSNGWRSEAIIDTAQWFFKRRMYTQARHVLEYLSFNWERDKILRSLVRIAHAKESLRIVQEFIDDYASDFELESVLLRSELARKQVKVGLRTLAEHNVIKARAQLRHFYRASLPQVSPLDKVRSFSAMGRAHLALGQMNSARALFMEASSYGPIHPYEEWIELLKSMMDSDLDIERRLQIIDSYPPAERAFAQVILAQAEIEELGKKAVRPRIQEAIALTERMFGLAPKAQLAWMLHRAGFKAEAHQILLGLSQLPEGDRYPVEEYRGVIQTLIQMNRLPQARKMLATLQQRLGDTSSVELTRRVLADLIDQHQWNDAFELARELPSSVEKVQTLSSMAVQIHKGSQAGFSKTDVLLGLWGGFLLAGGIYYVAQPNYLAGVLMIAASVAAFIAAMYPRNAPQQSAKTSEPKKAHLAPWLEQIFLKLRQLEQAVWVDNHTVDLRRSDTRTQFVQIIKKGNTLVFKGATPGEGGGKTILSEDSFVMTGFYKSGQRASFRFKGAKPILGMGFNGREVIFVGSRELRQAFQLEKQNKPAATPQQFAQNGVRVVHPNEAEEMEDLQILIPWPPHSMREDGFSVVHSALLIAGGFLTFAGGWISTLGGIMLAVASWSIFRNRPTPPASVALSPVQRLMRQAA